jgi:hypothetical protein
MAAELRLFTEGIFIGSRVIINFIKRGDTAGFRLLHHSLADRSFDTVRDGLDGALAGVFFTVINIHFVAALFLALK